jgi:dethiobiotin synthetase
MGEVIAISGIDTDIGKTVATGLMARALREAGMSVITQKVVQTGCTGISEDIIRHRQLMGIDLCPEDQEMTTCSQVFSFPGSPHLAAALENRRVEIGRISAATRHLAERYQVVLLEGAGGLHVPLTDELLFVDYLEEQGWPVILVTGSRLGSINHTLMSLEIAAARKIPIRGLIYNRFGTVEPRIASDSAQVFRNYLKRYGFADSVVELADLQMYHGDQQLPNFLQFLQST